MAEFYQTALGRAPEANGLDYYLGPQGTGSTLQVAQCFIASKEFAARYGPLGDTAFINQMYANAFNRPPDAGGLAYYQDMLTHASSASQGRALLLAGFMDFAEMAIKLVGLADQGTPLLG